MHYDVIKINENAINSQAIVEVLHRTNRTHTLTHTFCHQQNNVTEHRTYKVNCVPIFIEKY